MRKKNKPSNPDLDTAGFNNLSDSVDFYSSGATEQPLSGKGVRHDVGQIRKTDRHASISGRRQNEVDIREKMALVSILKTVFLILLLVVAFAMLWKGIKIYEESVWLENRAEDESSPVLQEVVMVENFDLSDETNREQFAERIEIWKEAERLVESARTLLQRNNYDEAILRCQNALQLDPAHMEALALLGELYFAKGQNVEAANAYIRLLSVDPSSEAVQKRLIGALERVGDHEAVRFMAEWYLAENLYDTDVQRHLANALFADEDYENAAAAYGRVLRELPTDVEAMERRVESFLLIGRYKEALPSLTRLREYNYRNPVYYRQIAVCNAQLEQGYEAVQVLGRAAQVFGDKVVMSWMQDPQLDPIREDRTFKSFADRVGGEGFRKWLEKMSKSIETSGQSGADIGPMLTLPENERQESELLRPKE